MSDCVHPEYSDDFEGSTHTGEAFLEFAYDLLEYTVPKYGYKWSKQTNLNREYKKVFRETFGEAVILFRNRHEREFRDRLDAFNEVSDENENLTHCSDEFCARIFQGKIPLMEFIAYCAFLLDTSLFLFGINALDEVDLVGDEIYGVFYKYVEQYFTTIGGWHALYRVAEQYVNFVNFTPGTASESFEVSKL